MSFEDIRAYMNEKFDDIQKIKINNPTLYIDGEEVSYHEGKRRLTLCKIREDPEWTNIENLYLRALCDAYAFGINRCDFVNKSIRYFNNIDDDNEPSERYKKDVKDSREIKIWDTFSMINQKVVELSKKYNININLENVEYISKLKKYSELKVKWKQNTESKVYYIIYIGNPLENERKYFNETLKSMDGIECIKPFGYEQNKIIFNDDLNPELYITYLEIKEEKNKDVNCSFSKIKKSLENADLTNDEKLSLVKLIMKSK